MCIRDRVEDAHHVWVVERGRQPRLGTETPKKRLISRQHRVQDLYGDATSQTRVTRRIDLGGRAGTDRGEQPIPLSLIHI